MNDIANTNTQDLSLLDGLATQARMLTENIAMNMLQLGRVLTEAKRLVGHGNFGNWLQDNCGLSERYAQQFMQAYSRFGVNTEFASIGKTKLLKMLSLPPGTEEEFMENNDVAAMSSREVDEAVKKVREEAQAEIAKERAAREAAEKRAEEAESRPPEIPPELTAELESARITVERQNTQIQQLHNTGNESLAEQRRLTAENGALKARVAEQEQLMEMQQEQLSDAQAQLLSMKSEAAKGDAERVPSDRLTADMFASAVRQFMGAVAVMPHMRTAFAVMLPEEKAAYDELLSTVEGWARSARHALDTTAAEGSVL